MPKKRKNDSIFDEEYVRQAAKESESLRDALLIRNANFDSNKFLAASTLITALRAFEKFSAQGIPFDNITAEFIVDFLQNGEEVIEKWRKTNNAKEAQ